MEWYVIAVIAAFAVLVVMLVIGTVVFFRMAISRYQSKEDKKLKTCWEDGGAPEINPNHLKWHKETQAGRKYVLGHVTESFEVTSYDGLKLRARLVPAENQRAIVLLMHGFRSNPLHDFACAVKPYNDRGFSCVLPYQRAHGDSEGKYLYFGTKEKYDVVSWCRLLEEKYPGVPVLLDGISMGAATVLMASGLDLPRNVKGIVADCGFTSPKDIFRSVMINSYKISPFPFLATTSLAARIICGFNFRESTKTALEKNNLPLFIAHGQADTFVPHFMSEENFEVASKYCDVEFFSCPEAEHGLSFMVDRNTYLAYLDRLIDKCIK